MKNFKILKIRSFIEKKRGTLIAFDKIFKKYKIKNAFIIDAKKNSLRGNHSHKKATQIFICLDGKIEISITDKFTTSILILTEKKNIVLIKPNNWVEIKFVSKGKILVFSNEEYKKNEYINDFKKFQKNFKR